MHTSTRFPRLFLALALLHTAAAHAAGFALIEQSASGMGAAFAGAAATAEDASTVFFNPAGMTYLPERQQVVLAGHAIKPTAEFSNNGSQRSPLAGGLPTFGNNGGDAGHWALVPNLYLAQPLFPGVKLGLGVNVPFGLKTSYAEGWVGRYQALESDLKSVNINPAIAVKATDWLSLGLGFSAMWMQADVSNAVDFGGLLRRPQAVDGQSWLQGESWGWGWNLGALFQITADTRLGLAYRSQVHQDLQGTATFSHVPLALLPRFSDGPAHSQVSLPDSLSASVVHQLDADWQLLADVTWTNWSVFQDFTVTRGNGYVLASTPEHWHDTVRAAIGAAYQLNPALKLRTGLAYDESPVPGQYRTPRIPDSDRIWLSAGVAYSLTPASRVDFGYTHIFIMNASVNKTTDSSAPVLRDTLRGSYDSAVDILSAQFSHTF
ncbi:MAG: OmpP1/FadL family transporter [Candidatus Methylumidiphilus sp.]